MRRPQEGKASLRERRRLQTARDIQLATLRLASEHGFDAVTTEMIAGRAGLSLRTFFNYFPNKEAALVGAPPRFRPDDADAFVAGTGTLLDDLQALMRRHMVQMEGDREIIRALMALRESSPRLRLMHDTFLLELRQELFAILRRRLAGENEWTLHFLTSIVLDSSRLAVEKWARGEDRVIAPSVDEVWSHLRAAVGLLAAPD